MGLSSYDRESLKDNIQYLVNEKERLERNTLNIRTQINDLRSMVQQAKGQWKQDLYSQINNLQFSIQANDSNLQEIKLQIAKLREQLRR